MSKQKLLIGLLSIMTLKASKPEEDMIRVISDANNGSLSIGEVGKGRKRYILTPAGNFVCELGSGSKTTLAEVPKIDEQSKDTWIIAGIELATQLGIGERADDESVKNDGEMLEALNQKFADRQVRNFIYAGIIGYRQLASLTLPDQEQEVAVSAFRKLCNQIESIQRKKPINPVVSVVLDEKKLMVEGVKYEKLADVPFAQGPEKTIVLNTRVGIYRFLIEDSGTSKIITELVVPTIDTKTSEADCQLAGQELVQFLKLVAVDSDSLRAFLKRLSQLIPTKQIRNQIYDGILQYLVSNQDPELESMRLFITSLKATAFTTDPTQFKVAIRGKYDIRENEVLKYSMSGYKVIELKTKAGKFYFTTKPYSRFWTHWIKLELDQLRLVDASQEKVDESQEKYFEAGKQLANFILVVTGRWSLRQECLLKLIEALNQKVTNSQMRDKLYEGILSHIKTWNETLVMQHPMNITLLEGQINSFKNPTAKA